MTCATCDRLTRENRELREELAEWRQLSTENTARSLQLARMGAAMKWLGISRGCALVLLALVARSPGGAQKATLHELVERDHQAELSSRSLDVLLVRLRRALTAAGYPGALETMHGLGLRCPRPIAERLAAAIEARLND